MPREFPGKVLPTNVTIKNYYDLKIFCAPSGGYKISKAFDIANVYCDMTTSDGGGWIVIQRNKKYSSGL